MINMQNKKISVLGSTGSVGTQALDVARICGFRVTAISAARDVSGIEAQARKFGVKYCAMSEESAAADLKIRLADTDIKVFSGETGICEMIADDDSNVSVNSITGKAGLLPTLAIIDSGKRLALANKESLVVAGDIVMRRAALAGTEIIPVDSEHSAIFQSLRSGEHREIKRLILTASGGPFYGKTVDQIRNMTPAEALAHPTWSMGAKISIDSATLMNKGFEVIEAAHLFDVAPENISVLIHRESIIHSMVEYIDNSIISQMSVPDMRLCVQYAVSYPLRISAAIPALDFTNTPPLTFKLPDTETFALLRAAYDSIAAGGAIPAVLNAANEIAVGRFLKKEISFGEISDTVLRTIDKMYAAKNYTSLEDILVTDLEARNIASKIL